MAPDGKLLKEGDLRRPRLADTLEKISERGFEYFYQSNMTREMVAEINVLGGNYTFEDFANYSVIERNVTVSSYMGFPLLSTPPPSAGAVLSMILSVLEGTCVPMTHGPFGACDSICYGNSYHYFMFCHFFSSHPHTGYRLNAKTVDSQSYHYIVESFKLSYAYRILLGDPAYNSSVRQVCCLCGYWASSVRAVASPSACVCVPCACATPT